MVSKLGISEIPGACFHVSFREGNWMFLGINQPERFTNTVLLSKGADLSNHSLFQFQWQHFCSLKLWPQEVVFDPFYPDGRMVAFAWMVAISWTCNCTSHRAGVRAVISGSLGTRFWGTGKGGVSKHLCASMGSELEVLVPVPNNFRPCLAIEALTISFTWRKEHLKWRISSEIHQ